MGFVEWADSRTSRLTVGILPWSSGVASPAASWSPVWCRRCSASTRECWEPSRSPWPSSRPSRRSARRPLRADHAGPRPGSRRPQDGGRAGATTGSVPQSVRPATCAAARLYRSRSHGWSAAVWRTGSDAAQRGGADAPETTQAACRPAPSATYSPGSGTRRAAAWCGRTSSSCPARSASARPSSSVAPSRQDGTAGPAGSGTCASTPTGPGAPVGPAAAWRPSRANAPSARPPA